MSRLLFFAVAGLMLVLPSCTQEPPPKTADAQATAAPPPPPSGERLAYVVGCVNCHHQTPKEILNAPPLSVVQSYSLPEFKKLLTTGVTRDGRDMYAQGSIMGIVAREQLSHLTDEELIAIHEFLQRGWTPERAAKEEAKTATFPPPTFMKKWPCWLIGWQLTVHVWTPLSTPDNRILLHGFRRTV